MRTREKIRLLKKTQNLLQRGHDYVETYGYNIDTYGYDVDGPRCFIGVVRTVAGVGPDPQFIEVSEGSHAGGGDGPELQRALEELDALAKKRLSEYDRTLVDEEWIDSTGHYIEKLGFVKNESLSVDQQRVFVLKVFRTALTNVHNELKELTA